MKNEGEVVLSPQKKLEELKNANKQKDLKNKYNKFNDEKIENNEKKDKENFDFTYPVLVLNPFFETKSNIENNRIMLGKIN